MKSTLEIINTCFYEQMVIFIETTFKDSSSIDKDELISKIEEFWKPKSKGSTSNKKEVSTKKKRVVKEVPLELKCIAKKKDGDRCNGKKSPKGDNPLLCSLHNNNEPKYGLVCEEETEDIENAENENIDNDCEADIEADIEADNESVSSKGSKSSKGKSKVTKKPVKAVVPKKEPSLFIPKKQSSQKTVIKSKPEKEINSCDYIYTRGSKKNDKCKNIKMNGSEQCKLHTTMTPPVLSDVEDERGDEPEHEEDCEDIENDDGGDSGYKNHCISSENENDSLFGDEDFE